RASVFVIKLTHAAPQHDIGFGDAIRFEIAAVLDVARGAARPERAIAGCLHVPDACPLLVGGPVRLCRHDPAGSKAFGLNGRNGHQHHDEAECDLLEGHCGISLLAATPLSADAPQSKTISRRQRFMWDRASPRITREFSNTAFTAFEQ